MNTMRVWINGLLLLALVLLPGLPGVAAARAQGETCYWSLVDEKPNTYTASTAEGATSSIDGASASISYQGLQTTHTWTAPGGTLVPGDEISLEVSVAWEFDTTSPADMVNALRFSEDPCERALFDKWDYGPIQAWFGGHQAVVLYPWATNWMETGIVLDPWIDQTPKIYEITDWAIHFSAAGVVPGVGKLPEQAIGGSFIGIGPSEVYRETGAYPMFNGDYAPPGELKLTVEENDFIKSLPKDKQELFKKLTKLQQKQYLQMKMGGAEKIHKVVADCPLSLSVVGPDGARSGIAGGEVYAELEDVFFLVAPLTDGTTYTEMIYPANAGYTLKLEGTGGGAAYVLVGETLALESLPADVQLYDFTVEAGGAYNTATGRLGAPMEGPGGPLQPDVLFDGTAPGWINSLPALLPVGEQAQPDATAPAGGLPGIKLPADRTLLIGGIAVLLICGGALGVAAIVLFGMAARKRNVSR